MSDVDVALEGVLKAVTTLKQVINKPEEPRLVLVMGRQEIHQVQIKPENGSTPGVIKYETRVGEPNTIVIPRGWQVTIINGKYTLAPKKSVISPAEDEVQVTKPKRAAQDEVQGTKPKRSRVQPEGGSSQKQPADKGNAEPKFSLARCRLELRYSGGATPGPGLPEKFVLDPEVTPFYEVGRLPADGSKNRLTLDSEQQGLMLSRIHARFEHVFAGQKSDVWTAGSPMLERYWKITDQASTNGCMLNGVRVNVAKLSDGDTITFGGCKTTKIGQIPSEQSKPSIYTFTVHYLDGGGASAPGGSASGGSGCRAPLNSRASSPGRR